MTGWTYHELHNIEFSDQQDKHQTGQYTHVTIDDNLYHQTRQCHHVIVNVNVWFNKSNYLTVSKSKRKKRL